MRGKVAASMIIGKLSRITPAYAGKSGGDRQTGRKEQDHPRLCGEKPLSRFGITASPGSPPPMRGKVQFFIS